MIYLRFSEFLTYLKFFLQNEPLYQWHNDAPGGPGYAGVRHLNGASNRHNNVGQSCKIHCTTSKSACLV